MIGKLNRDATTIAMILNNRASRYMSTVNIQGATVDVEAYNIKAKRNQLGVNKIRISLITNLRILNNQQSNEMTGDNLIRNQKQFNKQFQAQADALIRLTKEKDWDLLGLQDQVFFRCELEWNQRFHKHAYAG